MLEKQPQARRDDVPGRRRERLTLGPARDTFETHASQTAASVARPVSRGVRIAPAPPPRTSPSSPHAARDRVTTAPEAPPSVYDAIGRPGRALDTTTRSLMERRLQHRFDQVRVHDDAAAATSARDVRASAYTVGNDIVFARGRYVPSTRAGQVLLAHELAHVMQSGGRVDGVVRRQQAETEEAPAGASQPSTAAGGAGTPVAGATGSGTPAPRQDFVFLMGADTPGSGNPFYQMAEEYYRVHLPQATFITNLRNLQAVLSHIATNITAPIGNLYIVSHANEDGTLSFALNSADSDTRISVNELRTALHPAGGGSSTLTSVSTRIDATTRIHIKGCDIGRTQQMVELLDEAFGGAGTVTAPTHEQVYGTDPTLERRARESFRASIRASHPEPAPVDSTLRGAALRQARTDRRAAVRQREQDIQAEITRRQAEEDRLAAEARHFEAFSGPMFQRPGSQLFTRTEITPEVARLYGHLSAAQQTSLVRRLTAADSRSAAVANANGVFQQQGQRAYRLTRLNYDYDEPRTAAEANVVFADDFRSNHFRATAAPVTTRTAVSGGETLALSIAGRRTPPGGTASDTTRRYTIGPISSDATLIAQAQPTLPNPGRYAWSVTRTHNSTTGKTRATVFAERVVAYLHHGSLDASATQHFTRPESDPNFFATSTFAPPPPPPPPGSTGRPTTGGPTTGGATSGGTP